MIVLQCNEIQTTFHRRMFIGHCWRDVTHRLPPGMAGARVDVPGHERWLDAWSATEGHRHRPVVHTDVRHHRVNSLTLVQYSNAGKVLRKLGTCKDKSAL